MTEAILRSINTELEEKKSLMWEADSAGNNGLRITYWAEVCKLIDKKHELEEDMRVVAKGYEL
jgi:hypothetical protein